MDPDLSRSLLEMQRSFFFGDKANHHVRSKPVRYRSLIIGLTSTIGLTGNNRQQPGTRLYPAGIETYLPGLRRQSDGSCCWLQESFRMAGLGFVTAGHIAGSARLLSHRSPPPLLIAMSAFHDGRLTVDKETNSLRCIACRFSVETMSRYFLSPVPMCLISLRRLDTSLELVKRGLCMM